MPNPSPEITLAKDTITVSLPGPGPDGTQVAAPARYVTGTTVGGTRYGYQASGSSAELWTIGLTGLTNSQKTALQSFFYTTVGGPGVDFDYTHTDGSAYGAQFTAPGLSWTRRTPNQWDVKLVLQVGSEVQ